MRNATFIAVLGLSLSVALAGPARAEEQPAEVRACIQKGLEWMAKNQHPDGHWEAFGGQYPVSMTALGGMAFLMEGSTIREGKYADRIRKAVDWLMVRSMPNGMLGNPNIPGEAGRYMYGHGFAMLFLASVYGEEEDGERRKKLEDILTRAVLFSGKAQTTRGGWGYVSAADGGNFDEGSVTITQLQALRAARNAGIAVPKEIIDKAIDYLRKCTNAQGGVIYSLGGGGGGEGRPALTAAAISCAFSAGEYNSPLVKQWIQFCQTHIPLSPGGVRFGHDEYTHYYYAQAIYSLGETGYAKLFPNSKESERLTWSKYKQTFFPALIRSQGADGSWQGGHVGPVFITAVYLTILQLDNATLPIYDKANN
ncbi:MAG TPA: prenyltransferase/squalene oxidase repeat-containing protein [Gemmataceae bacterium]|nr:prenyltransferase/squalene oxidase repeat-containing protein [Gemmataceae bacterium]